MHVASLFQADYLSIFRGSESLEGMRVTVTLVGNEQNSWIRILSFSALLH